MRSKWTLTLLISLLLLLVCLILLILTGHYLNTNFIKLPPLPDLGHRILPRWNWVFLFQIGIWVSIALYFIGSLNEFYRLPYFFFMAGFWFVVRIASALVTPLGIPADIMIKIPESFDFTSFLEWAEASLNAPGVLFFSGHAGFPFLGHLVFKKPLTIGKLAINLRTVFLVWSLLMAATVLLTRVHYTFDVFCAYFMTAGVVLIGRLAFQKVELLCEAMEKNLNAKE